MVERPRVLIIDDRSTSRHLAKLLSVRIGLEPTVATTPMEARRELDNGSFAVVLIDLDVPHDKEGMSCLSHLVRFRQQRGIHLPIIAVTAYASPTDRAMCLRGGADDYLSKPYTIEQFALRVLPWVADATDVERRHVG